MWWEGAFAHNIPSHLKLAHDYSEFIKIYYGQDNEKSPSKSDSTLGYSNTTTADTTPITTSEDTHALLHSDDARSEDNNNNQTGLDPTLAPPAAAAPSSSSTSTCPPQLNQSDAAMSPMPTSQTNQSNETSQNLMMMQQMVYYHSMYNPWMVDPYGNYSYDNNNNHWYSNGLGFPSSSAEGRGRKRSRSSCSTTMSENDLMERDKETKKIVQGQISVPIKAPLPEYTERRKKVETELAETMSDQLFNLKCKIYRRELSNVIEEFSNDTNSNPSDKRTHIPQFASLPELELNAMEKQYLVDLGEYAYSNDLLKVMEDDCPNQFGKTMGMVFQELLNSISNRLLFLIMVEYRSWFPQDRARNQIVKVVEKALWQGMEDKVKPNTELIKYVEAFVIQRSKNYRDVISRVTKRIRT